MVEQRDYCSVGRERRLVRSRSAAATEQHDRSGRASACAHDFSICQEQFHLSPANGFCFDSALHSMELVVGPVLQFHAGGARAAERRYLRPADLDLRRAINPSAPLRHLSDSLPCCSWLRFGAAPRNHRGHRVTQRSATEDQGKILFSASSVSPDGRTLLIRSDQKNGANNVALLDVGTKKLTWVTDLKWEAQSGNFSPDGKSFTYLINEDGRTDIYLANSSTLRTEKIDFPAGLNYFSGNPTPFSSDGNRLLVGHESSTRPGDIWVYDLSAHSPKQLTYSAIASLETLPMPSAQIVHYKTFDGKIISALLWMPFNLKRDGSNPAIVLPHGGPTGQTVEYWNPEVAALVSRGYICVAPNVRGSTGYGIAFQKANYQDLGGGDLQDEVYATKFLEATGYVNPKKIGITGGSYGGYMTLMAVGKTPKIWAAGVEEYGIINWFTMLQHEDALLQEYEKSLLGDPGKDRKIYESDSPITFIHDIKAPLLVLQGENDPRVPKEEAQQVVESLKKDGKTVDVHYYSNEGHGFEKRENRIDAIERTVAWFDKYLKGA